LMDGKALALPICNPEGSVQKACCRVIAKEERLNQSPLFIDFERQIASLTLAMTGKTFLFPQTPKNRPIKPQNCLNNTKIPIQCICKYSTIWLD
ncbi:MAG: hypothetical protein U0586_07625, partial [Candidatus Brocadiaceae bacterium]